MKHISLYLSAAIPLMLVASPALAQDERASASAPQDDGAIIVTARKRAEELEKVPASINVSSEKELQQLGAQSFTDILRTVPSLNAYQNGPGRTRLSIRGIANGGGNDNDTQNQETVGIYLDEVPISSGAMNPEIGLFDVERVEVLRGPQGTLFGAGSMAGTIRMVTRRPDLDTFGGKAEGSLSSIAHGDLSWDAKALINAPIVTEKVGVRASGYVMRTGGYIDNITTGEKDVNHSKGYGGRITGRAKFSEQATLDLSWINHNYKDYGRPEDLERVPGLGRDYVSQDGYKDRMNIWNATFNLDQDAFALTSSTSYFRRKTVNARSLDSLFPAALPGLKPHELVDTTRLNYFAQEVRIASQGDGPFKWILGGFLDRKKINYLNTFPIPGLDAYIGAPSSAFGAPTDHAYWGYDKVKVNTFAAFGELSYQFGDVTATGGLRYFNWKQSYEYYQSGLFNGPVAAHPPERTSKEDGFNPKANLSWQATPSTMLYAQVAKGFRYGGVNGTIPQTVCATELAEIQRAGGDPTVFGSDSVWSYEVGGKGRYADGRVNVNAAAFLLKWKDMQTARGLDCGFGFRENVGDLTSKGLEFELGFRPSPQVSIDFGTTIMTSELDKDVVNLKAKRGDQAPYTPKFQFNISGEYRIPVASGEAFLWGNAQHIGDRATQFAPSNSAYRKMDAYSVVNLRAGMRWGESEVSLFVRNLADSKGVIRALSSTPFDPEAKIRVQPRTIGITGRYSF